eukprot:scaffold19891_cov28-Tisochrysis_lutea.AAC.3
MAVVASLHDVGVVHWAVQVYMAPGPQTPLPPPTDQHRPKAVALRQLLEGATCQPKVCDHRVSWPTGHARGMALMDLRERPSPQARPLERVVLTAVEALADLQGEEGAGIGQQTGCLALAVLPTGEDW